MDQKRLLAAIAISIGILLVFDAWNRGNRPPPQPVQQTTEQAAAPSATPAVPVPAGQQAATATPGDVAPEAARGPAPRLPVAGARVEGSLNLRGAQLDQLVLRDYRETIEPNSPLVQLFSPRETTQGYFAQWGWTAADGRTRVPDNNTEWQPSAPRLTPDTPVTLTWDNGQGQVFEIGLTLDANYMVSVEQRVRNSGGDSVSVLPWARIRRERLPTLAGYYVLHEGFIGVLDGRLQEMTYANVKSEGEKRRGPGMEQDARGGSWFGFTDKYWLAALIPAERDTVMRVAFRQVAEGGQDRWQADMAPNAPQIVAAGATAQLATRLFAGAKVVSILDDYASRLGITDFDKAVDFGWFYFLTKPFFYAIHWLNSIVGNFGIAILLFTLFIKGLFFPLQSKAYHSMAKMKLLAPKMQELKERHKDDPQKVQSEMMALYRTQKINPASGCLPILIQIPVFFSLYKVIFVTIEMRQAPFFGWIHDLSSPDPTNLFNLFGLFSFDPSQYSHYLHMPALALLMGCTMWAQQRLNPQPPDPIQAKIFAWMPVIFTFMLASFPAGLVLYWTWNNLLSIAQQSYIMRHDRAKARAEKRTGGKKG